MSDFEQTFAYELGEWVVEPHLNRIRRDGEEIQLEPKTLEVLRYLLDRPGEIVSLEELLDSVWAGRVVEDNAVHRNVTRIRQALGDSPREPTYIETISKRGYRVIARVRKVEVAPTHDPRVLATLQAQTPPFPAYEGDEPYVFVCYSHDNREEVYRELNRLRDAGINVWYDEGISPGADWTDEIADAVAGCGHLLYFVSPTSVESKYCRNEVHLADESDKSLVVVHLEETTLPSGLQMSLGRQQALFKFEMREGEYARKLLRALSPDDAGPRRSSGPAHGRRPRRDNRFRNRLIAASAIVALIAGLGMYLALGPGVGVVFEEEVADNSVRLAPFTNLTPAHTEDRIGEAIDTDLRIAARASGLQVVGSPSDWEAGEARYRLEGSVTRFGGLIRVTAYLFSTEDGYQVWEDIFQREIAPDLSEQAEIASEIMTRLADEIDIVGPATLVAAKPEIEQTGALQGALDGAQGFDEFPAFDAGEGDE